MLAPVYERLRSEGGRFLAELRPATALFLQFGGLDFDDDAQAGTVLDASCVGSRASSLRMPVR